MREASDMKDLDEKVKYLETEIEKYKKIIVMQQECLFNESKLETFQKCCHCDKVFVNESFTFAGSTDYPRLSLTKLRSPEWLNKKRKPLPLGILP